MAQRAANRGGEDVIPLQDTILEGAGEAACLIEDAQPQMRPDSSADALVPAYSKNVPRRGGGID